MRSEQIKTGVERTPNRSLLYALGYTDEELARPLIGVVSSYNEIVPGHMGLDKIAEAVKAGIRAAGGTPVMFPAIAVCDGIALSLIHISNVFRASILDVSSTSMTLAVIGEESKNEALTDLLREFGILEMVRTGMVALERGRYTIQDERKETLEFNLGKML